MKVREILPKIFLCSGDDRYDLGMHFLRYQEYYESHSPKFKGKAWTLVEYMDWYRTMRSQGTFTYPKDWAGFNIPTQVVIDVHALGIPDVNHYDKTMLSLAYTAGDGSYLIGAPGDDPEVMRHELAHGLFYTSRSYRKKAKALVNKLPELVRNEMSKALTNMMYATSVHVDETQAYMATGIHDGMEAATDYCAPFRELFEAYTAKVLG